MAVCYVLLALSGNTIVLAQPSTPPSRELTDEIQRLRAMIAALESRLNAQQARLDQLEASTHGPSRTDVSPMVPHPPLQPPGDSPKVASETVRTPKWFERIGLRGYAQMRYNRLFETNSDLSCEQCDRSIGNNNGVFIRRARLIFSGDISDRLYMYFQPDFASSASGTLNYGQIRDLYFDVSLDKKKEFRFRVGQSKVPFGFENLQSSQNRLSLDRADALNTAVVNERDIGAYFMYAPARVRQRFRDLVSLGLKGSGDYGVLAAGVFNGQNANRSEANNNLTRVVRLTYPFLLPGGQIIEPGVQAYGGQYTVTERGSSTLGPTTFPDWRTAFTLVAYPQPLGFQAEYNFGEGPSYNPSQRAIQPRRLVGGYAQMMYMWRLNGQVLTPYFRTQHYSGGKKYELDARRYIVRDQELGLEWQPNPSVELTGAFLHADRTYEDSRLPNNRQKGNLLRLQFQFNY